MALGPGYLGHPFVPCFTLHWNIMKLFLHQFFCIYSALFSEWKPGKKDTAYPLLQTCILWLAWDWQQPQWKSGYTNLKPSALQFFTLFAKKKLRPLKTGWFFHSAVLTANVKLDLRRKQPWLALVTNYLQLEQCEGAISPEKSLFWICIANLRFWKSNCCHRQRNREEILDDALAPNLLGSQLFTPVVIELLYVTGFKRLDSEVRRFRSHEFCALSFPCRIVDHSKALEAAPSPSFHPNVIPAFPLLHENQASKQANKQRNKHDNKRFQKFIDSSKLFEVLWHYLVSTRP